MWWSPTDFPLDSFDRYIAILVSVDGAGSRDILQCREWPVTSDSEILPLSELEAKSSLG